MTVRALDEIEWTRANLAEVLPDQLSPQALAAYTEMLNAADQRYMGRLLAPESVLGPVFKSFHGRLYFNLSQLRRVCAIGGSPAADMLRSLGHSEAIQPEDEVAARPPLRDRLQCLPDLVRVGMNQFRAGTLVRRHERAVATLIDRLSAINPLALDDRAIWDEVDAWRKTAPDFAQVVLVLGSVMFHEAMLRKICGRAGFSYERLVYTHLAAGARSVSSQQAFDLVAVAGAARREPAAAAYFAGGAESRGFRSALAGTKFLGEFDRFLERYGHRGRYESDWALPRYHEDPAPLLSAIRAHVQGPAAEDMDAAATRQAQDAAAAWREFEAALTTWQRLTLLPRARSTLHRIKRHYVWREQIRSDLTRVLMFHRAWHLTLAGRFVARGWIDRAEDYFLLRLEEVESAVRDSGEGPRLRAIVLKRAAELEEQRPLRMPMLMREADLPRLLQQTEGAPRARGRDALTGLCVSPGSVEGPVVVMRDPREFARMTRGAILVAPATDPSWTPLFTLAAGVIVEVGGMLSHASTIAREYGLPALANVRHATELLQDGEWVRLDATGGRVTKLKIRN